MENTTGSALVTLSAPAFATGSHSVTVAQVGVSIEGLPATTTSLSADETFWRVVVGLPCPGEHARVRRAGWHPRGLARFVATITNSNSAVGQLRSDQPFVTGQSVTKPIQSGQSTTQAILGGSSYGLVFDPTGVGLTTVTASGPAGVLTLTGGVVTIDVTGPAITVSEATVGAGLQRFTSATLGGAGHGGVDVLITSDNPSLVRVSTDASTAGTTSITIHVPNGQTSVSYYVQGMENTTGSATVTLSTPLFTSASQAVGVAPVALSIDGLPETASSFSADLNALRVVVGLPCLDNTQVCDGQGGIRAGLARVCRDAHDK